MKRRSMFSRSILVAVALGAAPVVAGCAMNGTPTEGESQTSALGAAGGATAAAGGTLGSAIPMAPVAPVAQPIAAGSGWSHVAVSGMATDPNTGAAVALNDEYYVINGRDSIASSDLAPAAQSILTASVQAMPLPAAGQDEIIIVPKSQALAAVAAPAPAPGTTAFFSCSDSETTWSKDFTVNNGWNYAKSTDSNGLNGSINLAASVYVRVTGTVDYTPVHHWCIPMGIVVHKVMVKGSGTVEANGKIDAKFSKKWQDDFTLADIGIGTFVIPGTPIPITLDVPIRAGLEAQAQAELHADGDFSATAAYDLTCTKSGGCDGMKTGIFGWTPGTNPTLSVSGDVKVTPYAEAALHAKILVDSIAYAEAGIRASLPTDLFAYAGNGCGDANQDGTNEWVSGTSLDMNVAVDVRAKAGFLTNNYGPWVWNVWSQHVGFWMWNGGVFDPMVTTSPNLGTVNATMRMRPCYPFKDQVHYSINWNDGNTSAFNGAPGTATAASHSYASLGIKTIDFTAASDGQGRQLGTTQERKLFLSRLLGGGLGGVLTGVTAVNAASAEAQPEAQLAPEAQPAAEMQPAAETLPAAE